MLLPKKLVVQKNQESSKSQGHEHKTQGRVIQCLMFIDVHSYRMAVKSVFPHCVRTMHILPN